MRPEILFPLFTSVSTLKGVGPRVAPLVEKLAGPIVRDVLFTAPTGLIRRGVTTVDHYFDTLGGIIFSFNTLGRLTVDHAKHAPPLIGLCQDHFNRIRGRTKNTTYFRNHLHGVQNIDWEGIRQEDEKCMPSGNGQRVGLR